MTRLVVRNTVRMKLGETTATFWTDDMLNQWMEDGQKDIVWRSKLKRTRGTFTTIASTARYTINSIFPNCLRIMDGGAWIYDSDASKWKRMTYKTKKEMDETYPDWPNATSSVPFIYMEDMEENILELYPTPQTSCIGTNYARVYYSAKPTPMTSDSSIPDLDTQGLLEPALIEYVVATGFESRGYGDLANDHWSKYFDKIKTFLVEKENKEDEEIIMKGYRNV